MSTPTEAENVIATGDLDDALVESIDAEDEGGVKIPIFVVDDTEDPVSSLRSPDFLDGAKISQLKINCATDDEGSSTSGLSDCEERGDEDTGSGEKTPVPQKRRPSAYEKEKHDETNRNRLDLSKALDELSVATTEAEDLREAIASSHRPSVVPVQTDEDFVTSPEWKHEKRHVFILSEAGKPIYSRYGNEENLVTVFGLLQALVSVAQDNDDAMRSIHVGQTTIVFYVKTPLILVCVSRRGECVVQTQTQLVYFYNQIVSILTLQRLTAIFEKRRNYDLRRLLSGSERLLDNLASLVEDDPSYLLSAVRCLPLTSGVRDTISQAIIQNLQKDKNLLFAILVGNNQLISCVRMKKCFMHPMDLHIILNLIDSSESFKSAESWTPLCLPKFDANGFVYCHVSYLADDCQACLVLLTVDRDSFFQLSDAKQKIVERLRRHNALEAINYSMNNPSPSMSSVNIPEIRHFIYKSRSIAQFVAPALDLPYTSPESPSSETTPETPAPGPSIGVGIIYDQPTPPRIINPELKRLYAAYFKLHARIHSHSRPLKLIYVVDDKENWIGWVTTSFELYVAFEPLVKKAAAINAVNKLLKWVKKEEDKLFLLNSPTF